MTVVGVGRPVEWEADKDAFHLTLAMLTFTMSRSSVPLAWALQ